MNDDAIEFLISQRLDGTLDAADSAKLDRALSADGEARTLLALHERLDGLLRASRGDVDVDEDGLAARIAAGIDDRIDDRADTSLPLPTTQRRTWLAPLAAAAALAIGLTIGLTMRGVSTAQESPVALAPTDAVPVIALSGPTVDRASDRGGVASVSVGVPANLTPAFVAMLYQVPDAAAGRVTIRPAGRTRAADAFD